MKALPATVWGQPYFVGFVLGYMEVVVLDVAGDKATPEFMADVKTDVLFALASHDAPSTARLVALWHEQREPQYAEGRANGAFIASFLRGSREADATGLAAAAFTAARERAPVFDRLLAKTNERGRAAMILTDALFFDKISEL